MTRTTVPTTGMKQKAARGMRSLADKVQREHPGMQTHLHLRDAAGQVERGNTEGAKRHLYAAVHEMTPQTLMRHGHLTDDAHAAAKQNMGLVHRQILKVRDIEDAQGRNLANIARMRDNAAGTAIPAAPAPSQDMNAPGKIPVGKSDGAAAGPDSPQPQGSKQFANSDLQFSAETGALAVTPHPFGKPGGPGLWNVKGMELPPYVQNIAHALLRTGRAKTLGQAIAMARAATKRWLHGKNVKPEVQAASAGADADWRAKQAIAHAHTAGGQREIYELACQLTVAEIAIELAWIASPSKAEWAEIDARSGHADTMRSLADKVDSDHGAGFGDKIREAAGKTEAGDKAGAKASLTQAYEKVRTATDKYKGTGVGNAAQVAEQRAMRENLGAISQHMKRVTNMSNTKAGIELTGTAAGAATDPRLPSGKFGTGGKTAGKAGSRAQQKKQLLEKANTIRGQIRALRAVLKAMSASAVKSPAAAAAGAAKAASTKASTASSTPAKTSGTAAAKAKPTMTAGQVRSKITALTGQLHQVLAQAAKL